MRCHVGGGVTYQDNGGCMRCHVRGGGGGGGEVTHQDNGGCMRCHVRGGGGGGGGGRGSRTKIMEGA